MTFKKQETYVEKFKPKGQYILWIEQNENGSVEVISTNSTFWKNFFGHVKCRDKETTDSVSGENAS